jgi:hypothetical protein
VIAWFEENMMIVSTLIAATVASAQPAPEVQPAATPAPAAEKEMACCEKMEKGEGCDCCKDMEGKAKDAHGEHGGHKH